MRPPPRRLALEANGCFCHWRLSRQHITMRPLNLAGISEFESVRFVLTDMDETLTHRGRLFAATYTALENLQKAGVVVIPVTAAPAGWCDQMARMWPVDGVIGENGGFLFQRDAEGDGIRRAFWHPEDDLERVAQRLKTIGQEIQAALPNAQLAEDQGFRTTSLAFAKPEDPDLQDEILARLKAAGADVTVNNLWLLAWFGGYNKLSAAKRMLKQAYDLDIETHRDVVLYAGDSTNDAPMFAFFRHTVGVSTVVEYLPEIPTPPRWITEGPGGVGFVEAAEAILRSQR